MWTTAKSLWSWASGEFISPKVDAEEVEHLLEKVRSELPTPVFWLLGKTQSGKSSIIRALTGSTRAEIGNGFRPCTRTAQQYPFPDEADPLIRFLDTRGLGEVDYDPTEDLDA
ncbi:MAG TPA: GTPase domain-containing protein, partial [Pirellulales bacterium]